MGKVLPASLLPNTGETGDRRQETEDRDRGQRQEELPVSPSPCSLLPAPSPHLPPSSPISQSYSLLTLNLCDQLPLLCSQMPTQIQQLLSLQQLVWVLIPTPQLLWLPIAVGSCWVRAAPGKLPFGKSAPADETNHLDSLIWGVRRSLVSVLLGRWKMC